MSASLYVKDPATSRFVAGGLPEVEFLLGYKRTNVLAYLPDDPEGQARVQRRLRERSLVDHFHDFLAANGVETVIQSGDVFTPTPFVSHAILDVNRDRREGRADGRANQRDFSFLRFLL